MATTKTKAVEKVKHADAVPGFSLTSVTAQPAERPTSSGGRAVSADTLAAIEWLKTSHAGRNEDGQGAGQSITFPKGNTEYVTRVLHQAAKALEVGVDIQPINLSGDKVELRFATRKRRTRTVKPKAAEAATPAAAAS